MSHETKWTGEPNGDGVYLCKIDEFEHDEEAITLHVVGGKNKLPNGGGWICYNCLWKRIGDLPSTQQKDSKPDDAIERAMLSVTVISTKESAGQLDDSCVHICSVVF